MATDSYNHYSQHLFSYVWNINLFNPHNDLIGRLDITVDARIPILQMSKVKLRKIK